VPRDAAVVAGVKAIGDRSTRDLAAHAGVLGVEAKTRLPPRPRKPPTRPAAPGPHPRLVFHPPPVHGSGRNPGEQWFSLLQRKRLGSAACADKAVLAERRPAFLREWNPVAHPFNRGTKSVAKIMAKGEPQEVPILVESAPAAELIPFSMRRCT